jgi:hypothetical protein
MTPHDPDRLPAVIDLARAHYAPPLPFQQQDEEQEEARLPLSQYLWILKRYRWRILGFSLAVMIAMVLSEVIAAASLDRWMAVSTSEGF